MGGAKIVLVGAELAVDQADLDEAVAGRLAHLLVQTGSMMERMSMPAALAAAASSGVSTNSIVSLAFALERAQIGDGHTVVSHCAPTLP